VNVLDVLSKSMWNSNTCFPIKSSIINWGRWLTQIVLFNSHKTVVLDVDWIICRTYILGSIMLCQKNMSEVS